MLLFAESENLGFTGGEVNDLQLGFKAVGRWHFDGYVLTGGR